MYSKIAHRQEGRERVIEVFRRQVSKQTHKGRQSTRTRGSVTEKQNNEHALKSEGTQRGERKMVTRACFGLSTTPTLNTSTPKFSFTRRDTLRPTYGPPTFKIVVAKPMLSGKLLVSK